MFSNFQTPPIGFGPGSQPNPEEGTELDYMALPSGMRVFEPHLPELADPQAARPALEIMEQLVVACAEAAKGMGGSLPLDGLDTANRRLLAETLGEGEVSCVMQGVPELRGQEAVFAGIWTICGSGIDRIEVAPVPRDVLSRAFTPIAPAIGPLAERGPGVVNGPAIVTELMDQSIAWRPGTETHVINLSLLPHTPEDLAFLETALGVGSVSILSRGYGNCRISATALDHVWHVQFFNSMDTLILDSYEVTEMPEVAMAAAEDLLDSAGRLREVLEVLR